MRLFRVIIILSSLLLLQNCASRGVQTVKETQGSFINLPQPTSLGEHQLWSAPGMLWSRIQYLKFTLNDDEKKMHQSAVYHALNNAETGASTQWHSRERLAQGKVRIIQTFPTSEGYCRVYQAYIQLNGTARHFTNNACKRFTGQWVFLK